ncbi:unnamed protein product [Citrullus colocynthis]|uniref:Uncharacterized protein n=1 Tax=Citrullus colocynthis TaxID=252529 RepID=A0ABP0XK86_9ROSI
MMKVVNSSCFPSRLHFVAPSFWPATESKSPMVGVTWTLRGLRRRSTKLSDRAFFCSDAGDGSNRNGLRLGIVPPHSVTRSRTHPQPLSLSRRLPFASTTQPPLPLSPSAVAPW